MIRRPSRSIRLLCGAPACGLAVAAVLSGDLLLRPARADTPTPAEQLSAHVLTFGPGSHRFLSFGQSALWIQDQRAGKGTVYTFHPLGSGGCGVYREPIQEALERYRSEGRGIEDQDLALPAGATRTLLDALEATPSSNERGDEDMGFADQACAGSVRDAVERASGGRLRKVAQGPGRLTLRQHALRLTAQRLPQYLAVQLAMGAAGDRPLGRWDELVIPAELQAIMRTIGREGSWNDFPLVKAEGTLLAGRTAVPPPEDPPAWGARFLVVGLAIGVALVLLGGAARRSAQARAALGAGAAALGLVLGALGAALLVGWAITDHAVLRRNENILQLAPWSLALVVLGVGVARRRRPATRAAFAIAASVAGLAALGLLLKATPWFRQDNLAMIALLLPIWIGLAVGLRRVDGALA